jgi:hypothetical protein
MFLDVFIRVNQLQRIVLGPILPLSHDQGAKLPQRIVMCGNVDELLAQLYTVD